MIFEKLDTNIVYILYLAVYVFDNILYSRLAFPLWAQMALRILVHNQHKWPYALF